MVVAVTCRRLLCQQFMQIVTTGMNRTTLCMRQALSPTTCTASGRINELKRLMSISMHVELSLLLAQQMLAIACKGWWTRLGRLT